MKRILRRIGIGSAGPYRDLEKRIGYRFRDQTLLDKALMHRSHRFENADVLDDNQRMEFLGDAVLGMAAAAYLYDCFDDKDEGWLTSLRSQITSGKALADVARLIQVGDYLRIGKGEEGTGGRKRASNLTDALEAIIGAVYLDGGMKAVDKIFKALFLPELERLEGDVWGDNPKGKLQEYAQRVVKSSPRYRILERVGPAHATHFSIEVSLSETLSAVGHGRSKRDAERAAAAELLKQVGVTGAAAAPRRPMNEQTGEE